MFAKHFKDVDEFDVDVISIQTDTFPATKWCVIQSPTCRTCRSWCSQPRCLLGVQAPPTCRKPGQAHAVHSGASLEDDLPKTLPLEKEQEKKENFPMNSNNAGPFSLISTSVAGSALWNMQWKGNERRGSMTHVRKSGKLSQRIIQWAYMSTINRRSIPWYSKICWDLQTFEIPVDPLGSYISLCSV